MLVWLSVWSEVQIVCMWSSWCHCHPQTPSSLASFKSRLVLPFWYRLTQAVLEEAVVVIIITIITTTIFMVLSSWPKVIARVHSVHLMNVDWAPGGRQPSDQASRLGLCESAESWQLSSTSTIAIVIIYRPITEGGRLSRPSSTSCTYTQWLKWGGLGGRGGSAPLLRLAPPLLESEPSLPTAGPKMLNSTKNITMCVVE